MVVIPHSVLAWTKPARACATASRGRRTGDKTHLAMLHSVGDCLRPLSRVACGICIVSRWAKSSASPDTQVVCTLGCPPPPHVCVCAVKSNDAGYKCVNCACTHCGHHNEIKDSLSNKDGALCSAAGVTGNTDDNSGFQICINGLCPKMCDSVPWPSDWGQNPSGDVAFGR